nr:hypothetical protein [Solibacillus silvestris]
METILDAINEIVDKWDMNSQLKDEKKEIIRSWEELLDDETRQILLEISREIIYYSPNDISSYFSEIFPNELFVEESKHIKIIGCKENLESVTNFEINKAYYVPLRTKDRIESSNTIFMNFFNSLPILDSLGTVDKVEYILEKKKQFEDKISDYEAQLQENYNPKIEDVMISYAQENQEMLDFEYLVVVEDFVGSGESLESYLNSLDKYFSLFQSKKLTLIICVIEVSEMAIERLNFWATSKILDFVIVHKRVSKNILPVLYKEEQLRKVEQILKKFYEDFSIQPNDYCINNIAVSYVNSPNNNVPYIYYNCESWNPIFPRRDKRGPRKKNKKTIKERLKARRK